MTSLIPDAQPASSLPITPVGPSTRHGSRSHLTCFFRCGNACDRPEPNPTAHPHIRDEIDRALQRRSLLKRAALGSGAMVIGVGLVGSTGGTAAAAVVPARGAAGDLARTRFKPVQPNKRDAVTVPEGFATSIVMKWVTGWS
jgi:hypothetical protein